MASPAAQSVAAVNRMPVVFFMNGFHLDMTSMSTVGTAMRVGDQFLRLKCQFWTRQQSSSECAPTQYESLPDSLSPYDRMRGSYLL